MLYQQLIEALQASGIPFAEVSWDQRPDTNYGVIAIDGAADTLAADQQIVNQAPQGTVDLYTRSNDRADMQTVQDILNGFDGCAWYLNSMQYEDNERLIHWEWVFSLEMW